MVLGTVLLCTAPWAQEIPPERARLMAAVEQVTGDPARHNAAVAAGRERVLLCAQCHGEDGNSTLADTPTLAGQNPAYLLEQVEKFADGRRKNFVMQSLSRSFTLEDKVNISVYFASQRLKPVTGDPALARDGARIYQSACKLCHGEDGRGEEGYARLAGQRTDYVTITLKRFRENARRSLSADDMKRHNARMEQVTYGLTDRDIDALA